MSASDMRDRKETPDVAALIRATLLLSSRDKIKSTGAPQTPAPAKRSGNKLRICCEPTGEWPSSGAN